MANPDAGTVGTKKKNLKMGEHVVNQIKSKSKTSLAFKKSLLSLE